LLDLFNADVSGAPVGRGKPDPEIFLAASRELGVSAESCFVVEDAAAGVMAAKAGHMAALGIARTSDKQLLSEAGADLVVTSLDDVDRDALLEGRLVAVSRPRSRRRGRTQRPAAARTRADY
jgi:beta-phosphoglucomutase-like phosphatase (HAD superfamily)